MVNLKRVLITLTVCLCSFALSQDVTLTVYPDGDVTYTSDSSIGGYQFTHNGCADNVDPSQLSDDLGFTVSAGNEILDEETGLITVTVLAFSFTGTALPAGEDMSMLSLVNSTCSAEDFSAIVLSDATGGNLSATVVNGELSEPTCEDVGLDGTSCSTLIAFGFDCATVQMQDICPVSCSACPG